MESRKRWRVSFWNVAELGNKDRGFWKFKVVESYNYVENMSGEEWVEEN